MLHIHCGPCWPMLSHDLFRKAHVLWLNAGVSQHPSSKEAESQENLSTCGVSVVKMVDVQGSCTTARCVLASSSCTSETCKKCAKVAK